MADISFDRPEQQTPLGQFIKQYWRTGAALVAAVVVGAAAYAWYDASARGALTDAATGASTTAAFGPPVLAAKAGLPLLQQPRKNPVWQGRNIAGFLWDLGRRRRKFC